MSDTLLDLQNEIDRLEREADHWRNRAMVGRAECARLLAEKEDIQRQHAKQMEDRERQHAKRKEDIQRQHAKQMEDRERQHASLLAKKKDLLHQLPRAVDGFAMTVFMGSCFFKFWRDTGMLQPLLEHQPLTDKYDESAPPAKSDTVHGVSPHAPSIVELLTREFKKRPTARSTIAGFAVWMLEQEGHPGAELFAQLLGIRSDANRTVKPVIVAWIDGRIARRGHPQLSVREMSQIMNVSVGTISGWRRTSLHRKIVKKVVSFPAPAGSGADWTPDLYQVHHFDALFLKRAALPRASVQSSGS